MARSSLGSSPAGHRREGAHERRALVWATHFLSIFLFDLGRTILKRKVSNFLSLYFFFSPKKQKKSTFCFLSLSFLSKKTLPKRNSPKETEEIYFLFSFPFLFSPRKILPKRNSPKKQKKSTFYFLSSFFSLEENTT